MDVLANMDAIITLKLHVGIIWRTFGKYVIAFPIHDEQKDSNLQINYSERCIPIFSVTSNIVTLMLDRYINDKEELLSFIGIYRKNE